MTVKQTILARINEIRAELGWTPYSEKKYARTCLGHLKKYLEFWETELSQHKELR